ncbi:hypothetical protein yc1106_02133 [Curvularia clavata]|uniref:Transcription factor domain-containing protein n=1 Tax=Curvularia clavata TaxID=95742 RepID=A0A9Q9DQM7_CURCL|nr:hypothetical protein yc1106_02133 [Curvularia clavata]
MTESDGFADYFPHDMSYTDAISRSLGFPFVCMTQSLDIPSQAAYNLDQGFSNPCMPNDGSLAIVESTGSANRMGSGTDSCTAIDSNEVSTRADPNATCAPPTDACPPFPVLQEEELQIAGAELFGHVSKIPEPSYNRLRDFYISERGYYDNESFPPSRLLHAFVELYFEYFDPYLPFLHPMRAGSDDLSWILLTAVAAIGSQYSDVRDAPAFAVVLQNLLRKATHPKLIFFDLRPLFRLTDFTQRLPYNSNAWECCNTRHWSRENQTGYPDSKMRHEGSFSTRSNILSLYADERAILDSMQSSRRLRALIRSEPGNGLPGQDTYSARRKLLSLGALEDDIAFLDTVIDDAIAPESQSIPGMGYNGQDPMLHVVAILRDIPLRLIYASVGWQANDTEMQGSRERLKVYLQRNQSTARTCLWHASRIYSSVQSVHHPAYYSSLTLAIAVSYILLYDQLVQFPAPQGNLLRLDKVIEKPGIEAWASCVQDFRVHITGIGILDNSESSRRLLVNAEKILRSQRSWQSIARAVADCFSQMSKGQKPKIN